jgi:hypothetical protein
MAACPQQRAMSAVLSAAPDHPLRPTNAQLISMLWRFVREWRGEDLEPPVSLKPPASAMVGYDPSTALDKLHKSLMPSIASAEAARVFLQDHWLQEGAKRWRALVEQRTPDGLSGVLGLPQLSCNLCMVCVRRPACATVGQGDLFGVIPQNRPQKHKNHQHELALASWSVASAKREATAAEAVAEAAAAAAAAATEKVRLAEAAVTEAKQAGRVRGLELARKRLDNDERRLKFIDEHKTTAVRKGVEEKGLAGLSVTSTETWTTTTVFSEELEERAAAAKRPAIGGKGPAAALVTPLLIPCTICLLMRMYRCVSQARSESTTTHTDDVADGGGPELDEQFEPREEVQIRDTGEYPPTPAQSQEWLEYAAYDGAEAGLRPLSEHILSDVSGLNRLRERAFTTNSLAVTRKQEEESLRLRAEYRRQRAVTSIPERSLGEKLVGGIRAVFGRN